MGPIISGSTEWNRLLTKSHINAGLKSLASCKTQNRPSGLSSTSARSSITERRQESFVVDCLAKSILKNRQTISLRRSSNSSLSRTSQIQPSVDRVGPDSLCPKLPSDLMTWPEEEFLSCSSMACLPVARSGSGIACWNKTARASGVKPSIPRSLGTLICGETGNDHHHIAQLMSHRVTASSHVPRRDRGKNFMFPS